MQCDTIAFEIKDDGAIAVRADLVFGLEDFAAVLVDGFDCFVHVTVDVHVNEWSGLGRLII